MMTETLADFFLDWFNNYLTHEKMANDYGLTVEDTKVLIEMGREYHEARARMA